MKDETIEVGTKVKDSVTGYTGLAVARTEWLNGCFRITIQAPVDKDGKVPDQLTCDEPSVEIINEEPVERDAGVTGGPLPFEPKQRGE